MCLNNGLTIEDMYILLFVAGNVPVPIKAITYRFINKVSDKRVIFGLLNGSIKTNIKTQADYNMLINWTKCMKTVGATYPIRKAKVGDKFARLLVDLEAGKGTAELVKKYYIPAYEIEAINKGADFYRPVLFSLGYTHFPIRPASNFTPYLERERNQTVPKVDLEWLRNVVYMLTKTRYKQLDIATMFHVHPNVISEINNGKKYRKELESLGLKYFPLRPNKVCFRNEYSR